MQQEGWLQSDGMHRLDSRRVLAARGNIHRDNPDDTPQSEAVDLIRRFRKKSEDSELRQKAVQWWQQCDRFIQCDQWDDLKDMKDEQQAAAWKSRLVVNHLYRIREKWVSLLMQNVPKAEFVARDPANSFIADTLDAFFAHEWERNGWTTTIGMVLKQVLSHGIGWIKIFWDIHGDGGRGTVKLEPVSNYDLFLDENAKIREGQLICKWAIHRFEMTREDILSTYEDDPGGALDEPSAETHDGNHGMPPKSRFSQYVENLNVGGSTRGSSAGGIDNDISARHPDHAQKNDVFTVNECLYYDDTRVEGPEVDNATGTIPSLKYPNGRVMTETEGRQLYDDANRFGFNFYVPFCLSPSVERIYDPSIIYQCISPQKELNKRRSQIADHAALASNPVLVVTQASQVDQSFVPYPGAVIVSMDSHHPNGGVGWLDPPAQSPEVVQSAVFAEQDIDRIAGTDEIVRGQKTNQLESGVAVEHVQESTETVPQMHTMFLDDNIRVLCRNIASLFLDYVSEDRKYRFMDTRMLQYQYGDFNPVTMLLPSRENAVAAVQQELDTLNNQLLYAQERMSPEEYAELKGYIEQEMVNRLQKIEQIWQLPASDLVSFDVALQTGTRNISQEVLQSLVMQMYELGLIVPATLLDMLKFPNWEIALKMKQDQDAADAEAEQQAMAEQIEVEREIDEDEHEQDLEIEHVKGRYQLEEAEIKARAARAAARDRQKAQSESTNKRGK